MATCRAGRCGRSPSPATGCRYRSNACDESCRGGRERDPDCLWAQTSAARRAASCPISVPRASAAIAGSATRSPRRLRRLRVREREPEQDDQPHCSPIDLSILDRERRPVSRCTPSQRWRLHTRVANGPEGVRANIRDARAEIQPVQRRLRFCRRCRHPEILVPPVEQRATAATDREPAATMSPGLGSNSGRISPPHVPYSNVFRAHAAF